jgi:hypothetical protein
MTIRWLLLLVLAACERRVALVTDVGRAPPEIREACALTDRKCSGCHDLDRILLARDRGVEWPTVVDRMRRLQRSGISEQDGGIILRCLNHISSQ